jgi:RNA polymerase sigma-70 factor (ECF subfamily)
MTVSVVEPLKTRRVPHLHARTDDPEVVLMLRVQRNDQAAFAELVGRYWPLVFGRFCRQLGDRQEAEDLTQEVFLRVYRHRRRYQPRARFATWLFHITQNLIRNALRARRRRGRHAFQAWGNVEGSENTPLASALEGREDVPSLRMERAELKLVVREALATLATRQRTALELQQFRDCSYAEIAARMQMTPKAAKSLLYRARNMLRVSLSPFVESGAC